MTQASSLVRPDARIHPQVYLPHTAPRLVMVTGADRNYFSMMVDTIESIRHADIGQRYALGILDCGLTPAQREQLEPYGAMIVKPEWDLNVPLELRRYEGDLGRVSRPMLRKYFPGYDMYFWIDADAWIQDGSCVDAYTSLARRKGMAVVCEKEKAYEFQMLVFKWNLGNYYLNYGVMKAAYLHWLCKPINNGVMALRADAPHWDRWCSHYRRTILRSKKLYNQIPLAAAIHLEGLEVGYLEGRHNWICSRGRPYWDEKKERLCMPYPPFEPLTIVHLAGPDKDKVHRLRTVQGNTVSMKLSYRAWRTLSQAHHRAPKTIAAE